MIEDPDDPVTVMILKQSEWDALAGICKIFIATAENNPQLVNVEARLDIAHRIVDATD